MAVGAVESVLIWNSMGFDVNNFLNESRNEIGQENRVTCDDEAPSCARSICECDAMFAKDHQLYVDVYNDEYHEFYGTWDPESQCERGKFSKNFFLKFC